MATHQIKYQIGSKTYYCNSTSKLDLIHEMATRFVKAHQTFAGQSYTLDGVTTTIKNIFDIQDMIQRGKFHTITFTLPVSGQTITIRRRSKSDLVYRMWECFNDHDEDITDVPFMLDKERIVANSMLMHYCYAHGRITNRQMMHYMRHDL